MLWGRHGGDELRARFRTIWISDAHLGTAGCRAEDLCAFLKQVECDRLYLVGDMIDMWRLRQRWYWPAEHNRVVRRLLKIAHRGTEVVYLPGNHDESARQFDGMEFGGIRIQLNAVHETADGRRLLVTHGDQFDLVVRHAPLLSRLGSLGYGALLRANRWWNLARSAFGLPYHSLARAIKLRVKSACTFVSRFEDALQVEARRGGFDGVICGHIHKADLQLPAEGGDEILYANCGDWVESCSALVEQDDGRLLLIDALKWLDERAAVAAAIEADEWEESLPIPMPLPLPGRSPLRGGRA